MVEGASTRTTSTSSRWRFFQLRDLRSLAVQTAVATGCGLMRLRLPACRRARVDASGGAASFVGWIDATPLFASSLSKTLFLMAACLASTWTTTDIVLFSRRLGRGLQVGRGGCGYRDYCGLAVHLLDEFEFARASLEYPINAAWLMPKRGPGRLWRCFG